MELDTRFSSLAFGPDGNNLYAATILGQKLCASRFLLTVSLGSPQPLHFVQQADGGPRLTVGLTFDPTSTDANPHRLGYAYRDPRDFDGSRFKRY